VPSLDNPTALYDVTAVAFCFMEHTPQIQLCKVPASYVSARVDSAQAPSPTTGAISASPGATSRVRASRRFCLTTTEQICLVALSYHGRSPQPMGILDWQVSPTSGRSRRSSGDLTPIRKKQRTHDGHILSICGPVQGNPQRPLKVAWELPWVPPRRRAFNLSEWHSAP
jgi:hypothetical protein